MTDNRGYDLERVEALLKEATPGPWSHHGVGAVQACVGHAAGCELTASGLGPDYETQTKNLALIVAAINALPSMLSDLRLLKEARERGALTRVAAIIEHRHAVVREHEPNVTDTGCACLGDAAALRRLASGEP